MNRFFKNKNVLFIILGILVVSLAFLGISFSEELEDDIEVTPNSDLDYYLSVYYDAVDRNGTVSSNTTTADVYSGYLNIEDKLPEGLTFEGFITSNDGTFGGVRRNNKNIACYGHVVDDTHESSVSEGRWNTAHTEYTYHGLHYNAITRTVTFSVYQLQAGCELTIGIKTKTPMSIDDPETPEIETRRDFYNFGTISENSSSKNSNTVHAYMGTDEVPLYNVTYTYTGDVPSNAPTVPISSSYIEGATVGVAAPVNVEGYTFSGWTTTDATITDSTFTMPNHDVTLTGSFTEKPKYTVTYNITGDMPPGYIKPLTKEYYEGVIVNLDSMSIGDVFNGYRFLGWTSTDVTISDNAITMPGRNITINGSFEQIKYRITYVFDDSLLPPNPNSLLPAPQDYPPGTIVSLPVVNDPEGYHFTGWIHDNNFEMPEENITITGAWERRIGVFEPTIEKEIINERDFYRLHDRVRMKTTITNTAAYAINDIYVRENNDNTSFLEGDGYSIVSAHYVKIDTLASGASIILYSVYDVTSTDRNKVISEAELVSAIVNENYVLKEKEYKASVEINIQSKITICKIVSGNSHPNTFQFKISNNNFETWITIKKDECDSVYLNPGTYKITEIVPQEYEINTITGLSSNGANLTVTQGTDYNITFSNRFRQKGFYHSFGRVENTLPTIYQGQ